MSKSYKKYPIIVQEKDDKKYLNHKVRRNKYTKFSALGGYKKNSPYIYKYRWSKQDAINYWKKKPSLQKKFTLKEYINFWEKETIRK